MRLRSIVSPGLFFLAAIHVAGAAPEGPIRDVFCPREGRNFILYLVPEGGSVTKGQLVCSLGPVEARASVQDQQIRTGQAEASHAEAKRAREAAEVAVREYEERTFKRQLEKADGDIALAETGLQRANDYVERMRNDPGCDLGRDFHSETLAVNKARATLQESNYRKKMLLEFTKEKTIKKLRADVEMARVEELSCKLTHEMEKAKEDRLVRQIPNVQVVAPIDGSIRHVRSTSPVEKGAEVHKGQLLLRIVPDAKATPAKP